MPPNSPNTWIQSHAAIIYLYGFHSSRYKCKTFPQIPQNASKSWPKTNPVLENLSTFFLFWRRCFFFFCFAKKREYFQISVDLEHNLTLFRFSANMLFVKTFPLAPFSTICSYRANKLLRPLSESCLVLFVFFAMWLNFFSYQFQLILLAPIMRRFTRKQ